MQARLSERKDCVQRAKQEGRPTKIGFLKRAGCQMLREVDCSKNRPRARLGFVNPIRNGLRKIKNLIESKLPRRETSLPARKNGVRLKKEAIE